MLIYLDTVILISAIEGEPALRSEALARLRRLDAAGDRPAISDLTCLECLIKPIRTGDSALRDDYEKLLVAPGLIRLPITSAVFERATYYRALHRYGLADSMHLATAALGGCGGFLTNDARLATFRDLPLNCSRRGSGRAAADRAR
ncbi:MAG TPA: PIN domain-containing protein [Isosphaeraceae bacterium]|nr:PIN domain-containing protein [Isosphaeraceae bacterium]